MTPTKNIFIVIAAAILVVGCDSRPEVDKKKEELKGFQTELKELKAKISELEGQISELDPSFGKKEIKKTLITAINVKPDYFEHKIEMRGAVESRRNVTVGAEIPGKIQKIYVKEGQKVKKGQTLATLDASVTRNNIAELETSLELAKTVFERQSNLWKQNIGTEIQYLQAKNEYESLERKLATANAQLDQSIIRAPFSGSIDAIPAKEGEITQPGLAILRIVNPSDVYIKSDISERFIGVFEKGDEVEVYFPVQDKRMVSTISSVSQVINSQNRTFEVEVEVPEGLGHTRPNQVVVLKLRDYKNDEALKVPTMIIQRDNQGSYVFEVVKDGSNMVAKKLHIKTGVSYANHTEVLEGIKPGQVIAHQGYRDLAEGVYVKITKNAVNEVMASNNM